MGLIPLGARGGIMAKALITGGSGFIGTHLADVLVGHGEEVTALVRRTSAWPPCRPLVFAWSTAT